MMRTSNADIARNCFLSIGIQVRMQPGRRQSGDPAKVTADKIDFSLQVRQTRRLARVSVPLVEALFPILRPVFNFSRTTPLVTESRAFYNPSNTALEARGSFTRNLGVQPPKRAVVFSVSECLNIDLHFGNSQEH
jgi:hypothetical protein